MSQMTNTIVARAQNASKYYGIGDNGVWALHDVSIQIEGGRFTAIMGPSGSGKSTLMHCLAGLDTVTQGSVFLGNTDLSTLSNNDLTLLRRIHIGFIFQSFNLIPTLTAEENIKLPALLGGTQIDRAYFDKIVATVNLADRLKHRPSELSGGQQQRVAVARALAQRPSVIFADEPTGNLDSKASGEVLGFMRSAVHEDGQTIVMVTHEPSAAAYADRVVFLSDGKIVDELLSPTEDSVLDKLKALGG